MTNSMPNALSGGISASLSTRALIGNESAAVVEAAVESITPAALSDVAAIAALSPMGLASTESGAAAVESADALAPSSLAPLNASGVYASPTAQYVSTTAST